MTGVTRPYLDVAACEHAIVATTQQKASIRTWLFVLPAVVALAAILWALLHPREVCTSGGETSVCTDYSATKFFVATAGMGLAALVVAVLGLAIHPRRSAIVAWVAVGLTLIGVAVASQVRVIT
ncbi:MAG TPA: hypothetical protein VJ913_07220 [Actinomycetota bacterium]|nr:hypothetical protein [Actinomycetota bacterium]